MADIFSPNAVEPMDAAASDFLDADEPRVLMVRGYGPRWAGSRYAASA